MAASKVPLSLRRLEALETGETRVLEYGISDGDAFAVGLACGGTIRVMVEPVGAGLPVDMLRDLVAARAARRACGLCRQSDNRAIVV